MNTTTLWISGLAISLFAGAIAVRATQRCAVDRAGWDHLPPAVPAPERQPVETPPEVRLQRVQQRELDRTYERAVRKDGRAKQEIAEALTEMRHARRKLANAARDDELSRSHWDRSYRSANLRYESATLERRKALLSVDGVRRALSAQMGEPPSRVSLDSSK